MNASLFRAGRATHLKIVALSLVCAIVVVLIGHNAKSSDTTTAQTEPAVYAVQEGHALR